MALQPYVGKAVGAARRAAGLGDAALEAVALGVVGLGHAEQAAQVDEVRLRAGTLRQFGGRAAGAPLADEVVSLLWLRFQLVARTWPAINTAQIP